MVAVTGEVPLLVAVNEAMLPVPLAPRPMLVLSFVHVYEVALPVKATAVVEAVLHTTWSAGSSTVGVGFTVMVKVCGVPSHSTASFK